MQLMLLSCCSYYTKPRKDNNKMWIYINIMRLGIIAVKEWRGSPFSYLLFKCFTISTSPAELCYVLCALVFPSTCILQIFWFLMMWYKLKALALRLHNVYVRCWRKIELLLVNIAYFNCVLVFCLSSVGDH